VEPRARVSVWPGRRRVPGIVAPDSWGARGAECLPRDVLRRSSPATSPCDGTTARRCLCHGTGSGTTEARPPASSVPPAPHGGLGALSCHPANSGPDFRSSSSFNPAEIGVGSFNPKKIEPTSRQEARERRIVGSLKPFRWNPAGNQSRPVELDQQPEASLAWWVGNHPCEA